jgi:hypothetical protein
MFRFPLFLVLILFLFLLFGCFTIGIPSSRPINSISGSEFNSIAASYNWRQRDSLALEKILAGNIPSFLKKFVPVELKRVDSMSSKTVSIIFYVSPDYVSVGNDEDWARVPLTPMAAQAIADSFQCILPTTKMVDAIYRAARVKLPPVPLFAFRDSTPTMYHHHLIIEGLRKGEKGLIAGIKKDIVPYNSMANAKKDRVAIYGWHKMDGKPIQPFYTGHVNWYVDYSHGLRLVHRKMKVNGKWMLFEDVLKNEFLRSMICSSGDCLN